MERDGPPFVLERTVVRRRGLGGFRRGAFARVRADDAGVDIGEQLIPRASIAGATVVPWPKGASVRLDLRGARDVEIDVPNVASGRELLRRLRLDPANATATFRVSSQMFPGGGYIGVVLLMLLGTALTTGLLAKTLGIATLLVPLVGLAAMFWLMLSRASLVVGADGVRARWFTKNRFLPYSEIDEVTIVDGAYRRPAVVRIHGRGTFDISMSSMDDGQEMAELIAERIRDAKTGAGIVDTAPSDTLDRGARSFSEWVAHLKTVGSGATAGMRTAPIPPERLLRIVGDPRQPPETRIAAAIAASGAGEATSRARILEVASAAASPKFRVALEAAADPEREQELEELVADADESELRA